MAVTIDTTEVVDTDSMLSGAALYLPAFLDVYLPACQPIQVCPSHSTSSWHLPSS